MIALIDNYDSFVYNIYQIVSHLIPDKPSAVVRVFRNDGITLDELEKLQPSHIIISPGPGIPAEAGVSLPLVRRFAGRLPILGICLGNQCIGEAFGAKLVQARRIVHGKVESIAIDGQGILRNLPNPCPFTRYHSLAVPAEGLPAELEVTARSPDGEVMGLRHREYFVEGVQFHPESIGSLYGERLLANFLN